MLSASRVCLSGLFFGLALGACSAIVDFAECKIDLDCEGAGQSFVCGPAGTCVPGDDGGSSTSTTTSSSTTDPTTGGSSSTTSEDTSTSTTEAVTGSSTGSSSTGGPLACASHTECVAAEGDDHICGKEGLCVSALSPECTEFHWPSDTPTDKVVFLGSIMSTSPPFDTLVVPLQNAVLLAVEDFNANSDLPGGYKFAYVVCDDQGELAKAQAAATHLSDVVGVPAFVGPIFSELVLGLADQIKASGTLMMSPTASAKAISSLADDGLVWRTIASDVYQASALADRIPLLQPKPAKVALLYKDDAYGNGLLSDTLGRLTEKEPGIVAKAYKYPNPVGLTMAELMNMYGTVVASAWGAPGTHPDTIVLLGTSEVNFLILGFMTAWDLENPDPPLPRFIVSHGAVPSLPALIDAAPANAKQALMMITEGVAPIIFDPTNFNNFNLRYKIRFNDQDPLTASSLSYDAAMVLMLAMAGVPDGEPLSGANISAAITKLVDKTGIPVSFGEVDGVTLLFIKKARNNLVAGKTVDLRGVSGELDFDLVPGEVRTDLFGWGIDPNANMPDKGVIDPKRLYELNMAPAVDGVWSDLP